MVDAGFPTCCYRVDADDVLIWTDNSWSWFARNNGATELAQSSVQGRCLWDFIADESTRRLYAQVHRRVRTTGKPLVLPVRCDSPNLKREIQMTISKEESGVLHYRCVQLRVEVQTFLAMLEPTIPRSSERLKMCSCCKKLCVEPEGWVDIEKVAAVLHLFAREVAPQLDYSVCPDCAVAVAAAPGEI